MLIFKKEKLVVELVLRHMKKTEECVKKSTSSVRVYVSGGRSALESLDSQVNHLETEADTILREIRDVLYSGAYLPSIRGDVYRLMSTVDGVSNKAESCFDFFKNQMPDIGEEFRTDFSTLLDLTDECFAEFQKALLAYFAPKDEVDLVRRCCNSVGELESRIDQLERELTVKIFDSALDLSVKIHLRQALRRIVAISDATENSADELELISLKSVV